MSSTHGGSAVRRSSAGCFRHSPRTPTCPMPSPFSAPGRSTAAMRRTQLGSSHYFQRPFRTETSDGLFDIRYDPTRTSLRGYGLYARLAKESGDWLWETQQNWRSPGFEVNDLGTLSRTGYKWMMADVLRQWTKPTSWYRDAAAIVGGQTAFNYEGDRTDLQSEISGRVTLPNYIGVSGFVINHPPVLDPLRTRGGVVQKTSGYNFLAINFWGDQRNAISWDGGSSQGRNITDAGWQADGYADLGIKPLVNVRLSFGPYYSRNVEPNQFVTTVTDQTATAFGGQRNGSEGYGDFDFMRDKSALFRDRPVNVFQIKASYWLGM